MKIVVTPKEEIFDMNSNTKQDTNFLNISSNFNHGDGASGISGTIAGNGVDKSDSSGVAAPPVTLSSPSHQTSQQFGGQDMANLEYLKNLAVVMSRQQDANKNTASAAAGASSSSSQQANNGSAFIAGGVNSNNFQGDPSSGNNGNNGTNFVNMQNNNASSDTDTCASSTYPGRRVSRDSLVSHDSLSDMISVDQVASNNLAMMSMLQQQQQIGGGNANMNWNFGNNNGSGNQALNQSMNHLMMNGSMNMNHLTQLEGSMISNAMGRGWNPGIDNKSNELNMKNDPTFQNAYGVDNGGVGNSNGGVGTAPLLIPPKKTKNKHKQTFAQKLMHILSVKDCQQAIRWMPNGCAFCIVDSKALVDKVLPKYFKEAKYTSFTRKLNRWGFKHFTLPTSEPSQEKEMSIYTHDKFLRDNQALCQQMDGGHRRRNTANSSSFPNGSVGSGLGMQEFGGGGNGIGSFVGSQQLEQHQNMMMQQMQQLQQQSLMMQQMQQQVQQQQQIGVVGQGNNNMFDVSNMGGGGGGGGGSNNFNSLMFNNNNSTNNSNPMMGNNMNSMNNLMDSNGEAIMGMRRTSLGFMPYLPTSNRRDSGFSMGGMSTISNDIGSSFTNNNGAGGGGGLDGEGGQVGGSAQQSLEKIKIMRGGDNHENDIATGDVSNSQVSHHARGNIGDGNNEAVAVKQEDYEHSQAKLDVLKDMIAKEQRKQPSLSNFEPDPVAMV